MLWVCQLVALKDLRPSQNDKMGLKLISKITVCKIHDPLSPGQFDNIYLLTLPHSNQGQQNYFGGGRGGGGWGGGGGGLKTPFLSNSIIFKKVGG